MKNPDIEITILQDFPRVKHDKSKTLVGDEDPNLRSVWIGTKVCEGRRNLIDLFSVKKRSYFGNTSMDAQVSLLMANQALVSCLLFPNMAACVYAYFKARPGTLMYDPFAGTGSMLYTAAHFGALVSTTSYIDWSS